ncbi:MAG: PIN domain-containing protein [Acidimicrobiales bacterium]
MPDPRRQRGTTGTASSTGFPLDQVHPADASAWSKARNGDALADAFDDAARRGLVATCDVVSLELLRSARDQARFARQAELLRNLPDCPIGAKEVTRSRAVQAELAFDGHHRGVKPVDLIIAAAAETASVPVLHYDHDYDYDLIASVTRHPVRWLAPRGALP